MAQTQTPNLFARPGRMQNYTPASDVYAGDIILVGTKVCLAPNDIASGVQGALHVDGVWRVNKSSDTFTAGDAVYWDADGNPVVGTAGTGCADSSASGNNLIGYAESDAATGDQYVYVVVNAAKNVATVGGSITADDITGSDSSMAIAGMPGSSSAGGAVPISGGAGNGSGNAGGATGFTGGAGANHTTGTGGAGGAISSTGGAGGTATSGTGGAGGAATFTSGAGGAASTSGTGGASGALGLVAGATGTTATGTGGAGGTISLTGAAGGAASGAAGIGGAGSAVSITGGAGGATANTGSGISGVGGAITITAGAGGACAATGAQASAAGGAVAITGGASGTVAGTTAAAAGGAASLTSGAGGAASSSGAGGAAGTASLVGGVGGAGSATGTGGAGGAVAITAGNGGATSGAGTGGAAGSVVLTAGTGGTTSGGTAGADGGITMRAGGGRYYLKQTAPGAGSDQAETLTAAQMMQGIYVHTISTGRTLTTPTGAQISAGCPGTLAVGDSFLFSVITVGTGADDISTLTAGDGNVTFVGKVTVGPDTAAIAAYGTWRFRNTGSNTWVGYRIG